MNYINAYLDEIRAGRCIVSKRVRKIYERLAAETSATDGAFIFDEAKAERPIKFIERFCRHSKGEWGGEPLKLALFQKAFISALFGFVHRETGLRRFREAFFLCGRKNGKSELLSALALYMMLGDGEPGAEVYCVATKKEQARLIFDETHNMIKQSPDLLEVVKKRKTDLYFPLTFSRMQPLGKNSNTLDGLNAHLVVVDELHSIEDRNLYEVMKLSQSARRQPLLVAITTAGTLREGVYDDLYQYACAVVDGSIKDDSFLPVLYELDSKAEWRDPMAWEKANPGLNTIKKLDDLMMKVERAKNSPRDLAGLLCKDFNVRATTSTAWLTWSDIDNPERFDLERFRGCYAIGGADLSRTGDLTCATLLFLDASGKRYVTQMYWLPGDNLTERVREQKIPYDKWQEAGLLRLCAGNTINYADVTAWFVEMLERYEITPAWIYYDSYSARYWLEEMQGCGFKMIRCIQGAKTLSGPLQMLEADLRAKKINYNDNPLLKWCIANTGVTEDRNGNILPIKQRNPKYRIDGLASLLDAYVGLNEHYGEFQRLNVATEV